MSEDATNPGADVDDVQQAGVAAEANAQGDDLNLDTGTGEADNLDEDGNPREPDEGEADDHEEIEHEGAKYKVPKALKDSFLRQQDYTKKTQEVADQRRTLDTDRQAWEQERTQQTEVVKALRGEIGKVERLTSELDAFKDVDWRSAQAEIARLAGDPSQQAQALQAQAQYNLAWQQFTALERDLGLAKTALADKEQTLTQQQTDKVQAAMRETFANLQRDIPGFGPDLANQIVNHGMKAFGLTSEEARNMSDPRIWKLINADYAKTAEITKLKADNAKLRGQRAAQSNNEAAQQAMPAVQVRGSAPATGAPRDDMPIDDWVRAERARMARKAKR